MKAILLLIVVLLTAFHLDGQPVQYRNYFIVARDGSGDYKTIQDAIYAVRDLSQQQVTIFIKKGIYNEKIVIPSWKTNISLVGEDRDGTIISYNDFAGRKFQNPNEPGKADSIRTYTSYTVLIQGNDCSINNLTIRNTAGRVGQAVALHVEGDRFKAADCNILGNQDSLYAARSASRQYYLGCLIEGTTDFIFGEARAIFNNCTIKSLSNSYITAAATRPNQRIGFVFIDCDLVADSSVKKVYLGRPWRPYARTVFINCRMGKHIIPAGWDNWRNAENEKTVLYAEYNSAGEGANPSKRVSWSHQLTKNQAKQYRLENIFHDWKINSTK